MSLAGQLEKIGRGLYRLPNVGSEHESLAAVATKLPQAVFCLLTALQFHELTSQLPRQVWIAMPRGSHTPKMDYPPIKMVQFTGRFQSGAGEIRRSAGSAAAHLPRLHGHCGKTARYSLIGHDQQPAERLFRFIGVA